MLFTGHSEHSIDGKLRLAVPAKYRNLWVSARDGDAWYCLPWPTGHLRLYTESGFKQLAGEGGSSLLADEDREQWDATVFAFAERLELDSAGRLAIPARHLRLTGLKPESQVAVVGARDRLEVHDLAKWEAQSEADFKKLPELRRKLRGQAPTNPEHRTLGND